MHTKRSRSQQRQLTRRPRPHPRPAGTPPPDMAHAPLDTSPSGGLNHSPPDTHPGPATFMSLISTVAPFAAPRRGLIKRTPSQHHQGMEPRTRQRIFSETLPHIATNLQKIIQGTAPSFAVDGGSSPHHVTELLSGDAPHDARSSVTLTRCRKRTPHLQYPTESLLRYQQPREGHTT